MPIPRSLPFIISAWAVPVLVVGQFAMVAIVPVTIVAVTALRNSGLRPLRWWAGALAAVFATALILWAALPDRAPSLSKDMHPVVAGAIVAVAVATAVVYHLRRRASGARTAEPIN